MLTLNMAMIFFVSCVGSCIFFTLGRFVGRVEAETDAKNKKIKNKKKIEQVIDIERFEKNVIDISERLNRKKSDREGAIDMLSSYTLVYSKKDDRFVRVPREIGELIKEIDRKV